MTVDTPERITILGYRHLHVSEDQGRTWTKKRNVLKIRVARMTPLFNPNPAARVLATEPQPYPNERRIKLYLWGDNGFLTASKKAPISKSPR
ncbi:MAG: hypothetical protein ACETWT_05715 [Thermodesulfobacteriota bacterium]